MLEVIRSYVRSYYKLLEVMLQTKLVGWKWLGRNTYPEHLPTHVGNPVLLQSPVLGGLDQVRHRPSTTELHHQLSCVCTCTKKKNQ